MDTPGVDVSNLDLDPAHHDLVKRVSSSLAISSSPTGTYHSPSWSKTGNLSRASTMPSTKHLKPFNTEDIRILLLENVNKTGVDLLKDQGYQVETVKSSLPEDQLIEKIRCGNSTTLLEF